MTTEKVIEIIRDVEAELERVKHRPRRPTDFIGAFIGGLTSMFSDPEPIVETVMQRPSIEEALLRDRLRTDTQFRAWLKAECAKADEAAHGSQQSGNTEDTPIQYESYAGPARAS